jgi:hypothetical protein
LKYSLSGCVRNNYCGEYFGGATWERHRVAVELLSTNYVNSNGGLAYLGVSLLFEDESHRQLLLFFFLPLKFQK